MSNCAGHLGCEMAPRDCPGGPLKESLNIFRKAENDSSLGLTPEPRAAIHFYIRRRSYAEESFSALLLFYLSSLFLCFTSVEDGGSIRLAISSFMEFFEHSLVFFPEL